MTTALRRTALAAALVAISSSAMAGVVVIDINFDALGAQAAASNTAVEFQGEQGLNFSGGYVAARNCCNVPDVGMNNTSAGYLTNRLPSGSNGQNILLSLEDLVTAVTGLSAASAYPNQFISAITFSVFTRSSLPTVTFTDRNNVTNSKLATPGGAFWSHNNSFTFDPLDQVSTLSFSVGGGFFAIDNLSVTLTDGGTGGNVPEPASYALVGLALLLAGSASRRRG